MKIKYPPSAIKRVDRELKDLMLNIIKTKRGGRTKGGKAAPATTLRRVTGNLQRQIKPVIKVKKNELVIDIEVVKYYQWLDEGSEKIKRPWFLTKEFTEHKKFLSSIEKLVALGIKTTIESEVKSVLE
jgi:hypothetical protein